MASISNIIPGGFNSANIDPQQARSTEVLPVGVYTAEITNSEVRELKSGNGTGLSLEFTIIDPAPFAGRKVFQNLNLVHTNEQAQQIGQAQLSSLCRSTGIEVLQDSDELFQKILKIRTKITPAKGDYPARADVADYMQAGTAVPVQAAAPVSRPAASAAKPWERKQA
jgi:hypothetical protein